MKSFVSDDVTSRSQWENLSLVPEHLNLFVKDTELLDKHDAVQRHVCTAASNIYDI